MKQNAAAPSPATLSASAQAFLDSVLALRPKLAVFDCDGTLWSADAGEQFLGWEIEHGLLPADVVSWVTPRYRDYKAGKVDEATMCGEMVAIHKGIPIALVREAVKTFFDERIAWAIFPEMQALTQRLSDSGCEIWAVSSTNQWVVEEGAARFGIPAARVIAVDVETNDGHATARLVRVPTDELKVVAIRQYIQRTPDAGFGNSMHDFAMLELARTPFAINPNPDLEEEALRRGWKIYKPLG